MFTHECDAHLLLRYLHPLLGQLTSPLGPGLPLQGRLPGLALGSKRELSSDRVKDAEQPAQSPGVANGPVDGIAPCELVDPALVVEAEAEHLRGVYNLLVRRWVLDLAKPEGALVLHLGPREIPHPSIGSLSFTCGINGVFKIQAIYVSWENCGFGAWQVHRLFYMLPPGCVISSSSFKIPDSLV